jgi:hypothetical protein
MADSNFTAFVRNAVEVNGFCEHSVFTEAELDWLLEDGYDDISGGIARLAEEAIMRTTGIPVDLSLEGPARTAIVLSDGTPGQEHNTFTLVSSEARARDFGPGTVDKSSIPKITPQDANTAVRSIDFPAGKVRGTPVDGMRLDDKDNPAEGCFSAQVTVAQILHFWGVNADGLIMAINSEWGIDYAGKLVRDAAYCRAADLGSFIASGGRPSPQIYMSPNVLSRYAFLNKPTVDVRSIGYSASFVGRSRALCKFIIASSSQFLGNGFVNSASFHMNPACMTTFDPVSLEDWDITGENDVRPGACSNLLVSSACFDDFVGARQPLAVARAVDRIDLAKACLAVANIERMPLYVSPSENVTDLADRLIMGRSVTRNIRTDMYVEADPRKSGAILFNCYNGDAVASKYTSVVGSCAGILALCAIRPGSINYAAYWRAIRASVGLGDVINTVNIASVDRNKYFRHVKEALQDTKSNDAISIALMNRHIDHVRPAIISALERVYRSQKQIKSKSDTRVLYKGYERAWLVLRGSDAMHHKPFNQLARVRRAATATGGEASMLEVDISLMKFLSGDKGAGFHTARPIGASVRAYWVKQYELLIKAWQFPTYLAVSSAKGAVDLSVRPKLGASKHTGLPCAFSEIAMAYCGHVAYVEMMYNSAMALAYRWAKVGVGKPVFCALAAKSMVTSAAFEVHSYVEYLKSDHGGKPEVYVEIDSKMFFVPGKPRKDLEARCKFLLTGYSGAKVGNVAHLNRAMREMADMAAKCLDKVKSTIHEAVNLDSARIKEHYRSDLGSEPAAGSEPEAEALEDHMSVALNAGVPESWEYHCGPGADASAVTKLSLSKHLKSLGDEQCIGRDDRTALCDLLCAVSTDVEDIEQDISEIMMAVAEAIDADESAYSSNIVLCSKLVTQLRGLSGQAPDVLEAAVYSAFGDLVCELSSVLGMKRVRANMIR